MAACSGSTTMRISWKWSTESTWMQRPLDCPKPPLQALHSAPGARHAAHATVLLAGCCQDGSVVVRTPYQHSHCVRQRDSNMVRCESPCLGALMVSSSAAASPDCSPSAPGFVSSFPAALSSSSLRGSCILTVRAGVGAGSGRKWSVQGDTTSIQGIKTCMIKSLLLGLSPSTAGRGMTRSTRKAQKLARDRIISYNDLINSRTSVQHGAFCCTTCTDRHATQDFNSLHRDSWT